MNHLFNRGTPDYLLSGVLFCRSVFVLVILFNPFNVSALDLCLFAVKVL